MRLESLVASKGPSSCAALDTDASLTLVTGDRIGKVVLLRGREDINGDSTGSESESSLMSPWACKVESAHGLEVLGEEARVSADMMVREIGNSWIYSGRIVVAERVSCAQGNMDRCEDQLYQHMRNNRRMKG